MNLLTVLGIIIVCGLILSWIIGGISIYKDCKRDNKVEENFMSFYLGVGNTHRLFLDYNCPCSKNISGVYRMWM